jgi:predicted nucleic acid-binding Zn ribbon protein
VRRREFRPVSAALETVTGRLAPATLLAEIQMVWPEAAGAAFAAATQPAGEREGVLTVHCVSSVWAQELDLMSERVVDALNQRLGRPAVRRLRAVARPPRG